MRQSFDGISVGVTAKPLQLTWWQLIWKYTCTPESWIQTSDMNALLWLTKVGNGSALACNT